MTLAAAASKDNNGGLFRTRDPKLVNGAKIRIDWNEPLQGNYACIRQDPWLDAVCDSPLLKRAWVFQERLLSPRTLYFAEDQLYWECGELYASESFCKGGPWDLDHREREIGTAARLPKGLQPSHDGRLKHNYASILLQQAEQHEMSIADMVPYLWSNIICEYSNGNLTFEKDKLVAISGVAASLARLVGNDTYFAGSWKSDLPLYLLWDSREAQGKRLQEYHAPSWSWASMATSVRMDLLFRALEHPTIKIQVLHNNMEPQEYVNTSNNIQVKGYLRRVSYVAKLSANPIRKNWLKQRPYELPILDNGKCLIFRGSGLECNRYLQMQFDEEKKEKKDLFCLEVATFKSVFSKNGFVAGLILQATGIKGQFFRVGYFEIEPRSMRRSWRAHGRLGKLRTKDHESLEAGLFKDQNIEPKYYEAFEDGQYTITII